MKRQQDAGSSDYIDSPEVNFPRYAIHNGEGALNLKTVATNATGHSAVQQYHLHNVYGYQSEVATQKALLKVTPGVRPFLLSRSTFPGSGKHMAHWLGDNYALWEYMKYSIQGALQFQLFQVCLLWPRVRFALSRYLCRFPWLGRISAVSIAIQTRS